ncbi:MAG: neutral/alkaline non-lysosomal ceramidase N-terminal domain-containing protein [Deltaproteobacteria bacterium]|nr:neutral/alkaline non-lysosomal ceramidase N-terminal domain-containing protein [Deltaproteobacteria bacterium]
MIRVPSIAITILASWCASACGAGEGGPGTTPLRAGVATRPLPAPVGVSMAGFFVPGDDEGSPFAANLMPSRGRFMELDVRALAVEGDGGRLVLVRADAIGMFSQMREEVLDRLRARTGLDLSDALVIGGTHTHSGPACMYDGALGWLTDEFLPELYDRVVDAIAETVRDALADLEPARFGWAIAQDATLAEDRRCQNPPLSSPDLGVLRFDRADGAVKALVLNHAIHGTVLHPVAHLLSPDVSGGIERKVAEAFDHPVHVMFFNAWAGDARPRNDPPLPDWGLPGYDPQAAIDGIERIGARAASTVSAVAAAIATADRAAVGALTLWAPLGRDVMGYGPDEFPFPDGAMCGLGSQGVCWKDGGTPIPNLDHECIPIEPEPPFARRTPLTVGRIGDVAFATFPGEAVTALGLGVREDVLAATGAKAALFLGYSQDFLFYAMPEADWWQGGYEPSFSPWGPRQGDWLRARLAEVARRFADPAAPLSFAPEAPLPARRPSFVPRAPAPSIDAGTTVKAVEASSKPDGTVEWSVAGGDPWLGTPLVTLEREGPDGGFAPWKRRNGTTAGSDGVEIVLSLRPEPGWRDAPDGSARRFVWTARVPLARAVPSSAPVGAGRWRLRFAGDAADAGGAVRRLDAVSGVFEVVLD